MPSAGERAWYVPHRPIIETVAEDDDGPRRIGGIAPRTELIVVNHATSQRELQVGQLAGDMASGHRLAVVVMAHPSGAP